MLYDKGRGVGVWEESQIGTWENDEPTSEGEIKIYRKFEWTYPTILIISMSMKKNEWRRLNNKK